MNSRIVFTVCLVALVATNFSSLSNAQTPFSFIHRDDVRQEIAVSQPQITLVDQLQPQCDAICQIRVREVLSSIDSDFRSEFKNLSSEQQQRTIGLLEQDVRESIELDFLDSTVLTDPQMTRFRELWTQQAGLDGLTSSHSSQQLGLSGPQISQIQNIQNLGSAAMEACLQNEELNSLQQNFQIQNIQINMINQCAGVLTDDQVQSYLEMCGDPFIADPKPGADDVGVDVPAPDVDGSPAVDVRPETTVDENGLEVVEGRRPNRAR